MTLPSSPPLSGSQVATELGLSLPLSMNHAWVIALAGKAVLPVSFSDLLGKTGRYDGTPPNTDFSFPGGPTIRRLFTAPWFGGTLSSIGGSPPPSSQPLYITFSVAPNWTGNILLKNNTTGVSAVLTPFTSTQWNVSNTPSGLATFNATENFTILPSN